MTLTTNLVAMEWNSLTVVYGIIMVVVTSWFTKNIINFLLKTPLYAVYICFKGSKSFFFASLFYSFDVRNRIFVFYTFARLCDDLIDDPNNQNDSEKQLSNIRFIQKMLDFCYAKDSSKDDNHNNNKSSSSNQQDKEIDEILSTMPNGNKLFSTKLGENENKFLFTKDNIKLMLKDLRSIIAECKIPRDLFELLLFGFKMDVNKYNNQNMVDLLTYCVCVASSVGLICSYLYKSQNINENLLAKATSLGIAFQLTNIARDIITDIKELNKIYVPQTWLEENSTLDLFNKMKVGDNASNTLIELNRNTTIRDFSVKLIKIAEIYYIDAWEGIGLLPKNVQLAVYSALLIYRDIGIKILNNKVYPNRSFVTLKEKLRLLYHGYYQIKPEFEPIKSKEFTLQSGEMLKLALSKSKQAINTAVL